MLFTMDVTGWFSANQRTGPGMVSVGTNAELTNGRKQHVAQRAASEHGGIAEEVRGHDATFRSLLGSPTTAKKISSSVGYFSTYSTFAGGSRRLSSASVPLAMMRPSWRIAMRSASCSASSRY